MNKKITFYFLTALVVLVVLTFKTDSAPTISKYNDDFWTPEKIKNAKPLKKRNIGFRTRSGVKSRRNTTDSSKYTKSMPPSERKYELINNTISVANVVDQIPNIPIGILFVQDDVGDLASCTASVINTPTDGNIGFTVAHCLFNHETNSYYNNIMFSPGFDNGAAGPLGLIPVERVEVPDEFRLDNDGRFDWGLIRFTYNVNGHPLQLFTGSLGYAFDVGDGAATTIRGYPNGGGLADCPNDGDHLCTWAGQTEWYDDFYVVPDLELGEGASGAPLMINYDPNTNLGTLYSDYAAFDELRREGLGVIYDPTQFQRLLAYITIF